MVLRHDALLTRVLRRVLRLLSREIESADVAEPAIVFSPHPDDETLGCGGTIIRKRRAGAHVTVVFMTDGSVSHRRYIGRAELREMRHAEAIAACEVLGVAATDVCFLNFVDGQLADFHVEAVRRVSRLLTGIHASQIFIPYGGDTTADHRATHAIVLDSVTQLRKHMVVYEYPVWFWHHWPWVSIPFTSLREGMKTIMHSIHCCVLLFSHLRWFVPVGDQLKQKDTALQQHRSQMQRVLPETDWPILSDVAEGRFLNCFFEGREVFYRRVTE